MSLFNTIYEIAQDAALSMTFVANKDSGTLTVTVIPKAINDKANPALTTPLQFDATPEELENEFASAIGGFKATRKTLADAFKDAESVMEAAKKEANEKASKAVKAAATEPAKTATPSSHPTSESKSVDTASPEADKDNLFA